MNECVELLIEVVEEYSEQLNDGSYYSGGRSVMESIFIYLVKHGYAEGDNLVIRLLV